MCVWLNPPVLGLSRESKIEIMNLTAHRSYSKIPADEDMRYVRKHNWVSLLIVNLISNQWAIV